MPERCKGSGKTDFLPPADLNTLILKAREGPMMDRDARGLPSPGSLPSPGRMLMGQEVLEESDPY
jgi:hypothetical protein